MEKQGLSLLLNFEDYQEEGLYLFFRDGNHLEITKHFIDRFSAEFLRDPVQVPSRVKQAFDFQACPVCPEKDKGEFCHALRPTLPFVELLDKYSSFEPVTVVMKWFGAEELYLRRTTLQKALQYISMLSLIYYCEVGRKYWKYFYGVHPLMKVSEAAERIYMNIFWIARGDAIEVERIVQQFKEEITMIAECQEKRLRLISSKDSLLNAFVLTQLISEIVSRNVEKVLKRDMNAFEAL